MSLHMSVHTPPESNSDTDDSVNDKILQPEIGPEFQTPMSRYGAVLPQQYVTMWNPDMLPRKAIENYLRLAAKQWNCSILAKYTEFTEENACVILHIKDYNINAALKAIYNPTYLLNHQNSEYVNDI